MVKDGDKMDQQLQEPRGCGRREPGGLYACCGLSGNGVPPEVFLIDPPKAWDETSIPLARRGMRMVADRNGVNHLVDVVGRNYYPTPLGFFMEFKRLGLSRRISAKLPLEKLELGTSKIMLLHDRALVVNSDELYRQLTAGDVSLGDPARWWQCIQGIPEHAWGERPPQEMCVGLWWLIQDQGTASAHGAQPPWGPMKTSFANFEPVRCDMPWGTYYAFRPGAQVPDLAYRLAAFLAVPVQKLQLIRDAKGGSHEPVAEDLNERGVVAEVVDE